MRHSNKPVRKCHACLLNRGDHCWLYKYPRGQWRDHRTCPAFGNEAVYAEFKNSQKLPSVTKRKEIRRMFFRGRRKSPSAGRKTRAS